MAIEWDVPSTTEELNFIYSTWINLSLYVQEWVAATILASTTMRYEKWQAWLCGPNNLGFESQFHLHQIAECPSTSHILSLALFPHLKNGAINATAQVYCENNGHTEQNSAWHLVGAPKNGDSLSLFYWLRVMASSRQIIVAMYGVLPVTEFSLLGNFIPIREEGWKGMV